jgi:alkylated DNA repair dioxygenase AlkB
MARDIRGLSVLKSAFRERCSQAGPCILADHSVAEHPCCDCIMQLLDRDEWLHDDHLCTGAACPGYGEPTDSKAGLSRRTQHYNYEFNFKVREMLKKTKPFASNLAVDILAEILRPNFPNEMMPDQCIVNEYKVGQSIGGHIDKPCFGSVVMTVSLLGNCRMTFSRKNRASVTLDLGPGDIVLLEDEARYEYQHEIERILVRDVSRHDPRRVSITYRTVVD